MRNLRTVQVLVIIGCLVFVTGMTQINRTESPPAAPIVEDGVWGGPFLLAGSAAGDAQFRDITDCPPGALFSQAPDMSPSGTAGASDDRAGWSIIEDFAGIAEPICDIHWWGINADASFAECVKSPDRYRITFYNDNGLGEPDLTTPACGPYSVTPRKDDAGTFGTYQLYYYSAVLTPCCNMTSGWVEIVGLDDGQDCWFFWVTSSAGSSWNRDLGDDSLVAAPYDMSLCLTGHCIPPGDDCWSTECGETYADFSANAIPPDFFGPGSDPFDGRIDLGGGVGMVDTIVQRNGWMCFPEPLPSTASVEVELVALDLVSCTPITVTYGGVSPELWDVQVGLSGVQDPGIMDATKTHANGGHFDAQFYVQPLYTFTRQSDSAVRTFDPAAYGILPISISTRTSAYWSTQEDYEHCTSDGFLGGYATLPDKEECCPITCHDSYGEGHAHCAKPPECPECPECEALPDQSACKRVVCPDPMEDCKPVRIMSPPPTPAPRAAGDPFPPGGTDVITGTTGDIYIEVTSDNIYGLMPETWYFAIQEGPPNDTVVVRGDPLCDPYCTVDMEMTELELLASDGIFDISVHLSPSPPSTGLVTEPEIDEPDSFPAESFFDVYVQVDLPDVTPDTLHTQDSIRLESPEIVELPPWDTDYQVPAGWLGVELYDGTIPTGLWIRWVLHGLPPPPPDWKIVECACLEADEPHVEFDPAAGMVWCEGACPPGYLPVLYSQANPDLTVEYWCQCDCVCGDIDHSGGFVNLSDFATFAICYGLFGAAPGCDIEAFTCSDLDGDGSVTLGDFATFATWYGLNPAKTVPDCSQP
jgi:hypothetical protein